MNSGGSSSRKESSNILKISQVMEDLRDVMLLDQSNASSSDAPQTTKPSPNLDLLIQKFDSVYAELNKTKALNEITMQQLPQDYTSTSKAFTHSTPVEIQHTLKEEKQQQSTYTSQLYNTTFESDDMGKNIGALTDNITQNISVLESFPKD